MFSLRWAPSYAILVLAVLSAICRPSVAMGQSSDDSYRRRSLASVMSAERETVLRAFAAAPDRRSALGGISFPSLPSIQFADSIRAIAPERRSLIERWVNSYGITAQASEMYQSEMLVREDSLEMWLPVHSTLIEGLQARFERGDPVTLFIVWVGARDTPMDIDWVFLVYGFQE